MANYKKKRAVKKAQEKHDLSYKQEMKIVYMDQQELLLAQKQYIEMLQMINEQIDKNMNLYIESEKAIINAKLQYRSSEVLDRSMGSIREKYKDILERYEKVNV